MGTLNESLTISGDLNVSGQITGNVARANMVIDTTVVQRIPLSLLRVWDAFGTNLPAVGSSDDIGLAAGTFGTAIPYLKSQDMNAANSVTEYARFQVTLPPEYVAYSQVYLRACMGMLTVAASVANSIDFEAYICARSTLVSGSDIVTTSAQSNLTTTLADKDFTLTSSALTAGTTLDVRVTMACNSATASSHFAVCSHIELIYNIKG